MHKRLLSYLVIIAMLSSNSAYAFDVTVTDAGDGGDFDGGSGVCEVTPAGGDCTFRAAIETMNLQYDTGITNNLTFSGVGSITLSGGEFPMISADTLTVAGSSAPGGVFIIDGNNSSLAGSGNLIELNNSNIRLEGLELTDFTGNAISLTGLADSTELDDIAIYDVAGEGIEVNSGANNVDVIGSFIGVDRTPDVSDSYSKKLTNGVYVNSADYVTVGGSDPGDNNIIGDANSHGIYVDGAANTTIQENEIGTHYNGVSYLDLGNDADSNGTGSGIYMINDVGASNYIVDNFIGFNDEGIQLGDGTFWVDGKVIVQGGGIGVGHDGADIGNSGDGIEIDTSASTDVTLIVGNDIDNPGSFSADNEVVIGNNHVGIRALAGDRLVVNSSFIGVDDDGVTAAGNGGAGIMIGGLGVGNNTDGFIDVHLGTNNDGSNDDEEKLIIGANAQNGIYFNESGQTNDISIQGVNIGVTKDGENPTSQYDLANDDYAGIYILNTSATTLDIGGTSAVNNGYASNVISNNPSGIRIDGFGGTTGAPGAINIENNLIGLALGGSGSDLYSDAGNRYDDGSVNGSAEGIRIDLDSGGYANVRIGTDGDSTLDPEERNWIGDNNDGIYLGDGIINADVHGNAIGMGADATYDANVGKGNMNNGITIDSSDEYFADLSIGGSGASESNIISGNGNNGIYIADAGSGVVAADIAIEENILGTGENEYTAYWNGGDNISVGDGDIIDIIGNLIANATGNGISITGGSEFNILSNQIGLVQDPLGSTTDLEGAGNDTHGIYVNASGSLSASAITRISIGGGSSSESNVIVGSGLHGIYIENVGLSVPVEIMGNVIGVAYDIITGEFKNDTTGAYDDANNNNDFDDFKNAGWGVKMDIGQLYFGRNQGGTILGSSIGASGDGAFMPGNVVSNNESGGLFIGDQVGSSEILSSIFGLIRSSSSSDFDTPAGNSYVTVSPGFEQPAAVKVDPGGGTSVNFGSVVPADLYSVRNIISGNYGSGLIFGDDSQVSASLDLVNAFIGTDWDGLVDLGNGLHGVEVLAGDGVNIGEYTKIFDVNLISGNDGSGILIADYIQDVDVMNSVIGMNWTGNAALPNAKDGIDIAKTQVSGAEITIGTVDGASAPYGENYIAGNTEFGVSIGGDGLGGGTSLTVNLYNNFIGLAGDRETALPNGALSTGPASQIAGVGVDHPNADVNIGDGSSHGANTIAGNTGYGVLAAAVDNLNVNGNAIGVAYDGVTQTLVANSEGAIGISSGMGDGGVVTSTSFVGNIINNTSNVGIKTNIPLSIEGSSSISDNGNDFTSESGSFSNSGAPYYFWYRDVSNYEPYSCNDGVDNDSDGDIDDADAGCDDLLDDDEYNASSGGSSGSNSGSNSSGSSSSSSSSSSSESSSESSSSESESSESSESNESNEESAEAPDETVEETVEEVVEEPVVEEEPVEEQPTEEEIVAVLEDLASTTTETVEETFDSNEVDDLEEKIAAFEELLEEGESESAESEESEEREEDENEEEQEEKTEEQKTIDEALDLIEEIAEIGEDFGGEESEEEKREKLEKAEKVIEKVLQEELEDVFEELYFEEDDEEASDEDGDKKSKTPDFEWEIDPDKGVEKGKIYPFTPVVFKDPETGEVKKDSVSALLALKEGRSLKEKPEVSFEDQFFAKGNLKDKDLTYKELYEETSCSLTNIDNGDTIGKNGMFTFFGPCGKDMKVYVVEVKEKELTVFDQMNSMMASVLSNDVLVKDDKHSYSDHLIGEVSMSANKKGVVAVDIPELDFKQAKQFYVYAEDELGNVITKKVDIDPNLSLKELDASGVELEQNGKKIGTGDGERTLSAALYNSVLASASLEEEKDVEPIKVKGYAKPGSTVFITWESLVYNSVVISDASQGYFEAEAPDELAYGDHEMKLFVYHDSGRVLSNISQLLFNK